INEISAVDVPAQEGARMVLMKRATGIEDEDLLEKGAILLTSEKGHAHIIYSLEEGGGQTSYNEMTDEEGDYGHSHPYVITDEGKIIVGEARCHTHEVQAFGKNLPTKTEKKKKFNPGDYAYVGDVTKTDTWKLRLTDTPGGEADPQSVDAAVTALGK